MLDESIRRIVRLALDEDVGTGDITTNATVPAATSASGYFLAKGGGVVSGLAAVRAVFTEVDPSIRFTPAIGDGDRIAPDQRFAEVAGPARGLLTGERVALNFLQRLSGVATLTSRYVEAVAGTRARVIDTRKTTPGMRSLEKDAVRHGGGHNHRFGLSDGILIKDNHLAAIGGADPIARAVEAARAAAPHTLRVEVEVTSLEELERALAAGADVILLDNMSVEQMAEAVLRTGGRALLEASGGISLETVRRVAETGVDLISVGTLTHSAPSLDISLEIVLDAHDGEGGR